MALAGVRFTAGAAQKAVDAVRRALPQLAVLPPDQKLPTDAYVLTVDEKGISVNLGKQRLLVDFPSYLQRLRSFSPKDPLLRAVGVPERNSSSAAAPFVVDATAGFAFDSFLLAAFGCRVAMVEVQPVMALLLQDALEKAQSSEHEQLRSIASRLSLHQGDSGVLLLQDGGALSKPDVVYIDTFFPHKHRLRPGQKKGEEGAQLVYVTEKRTAATSGRMAFLRALHEADLRGKLGHSEIPPYALHEASEASTRRLVETALAVASRIVVKRPSHAPSVKDLLPELSSRISYRPYESRDTRWDVLVKTTA